MRKIIVALSLAKDLGNYANGPLQIASQFHKIGVPVTDIGITIPITRRVGICFERLHIIILRHPFLQEGIVFESKLTIGTRCGNLVVGFANRLIAKTTRESKSSKG